MRILSIAYPLFPVNADSAGGAEQVLHLLEAEIVRAGHTSVVIAAEGSSVAGELVSTPALNAEVDAEDRGCAQRIHRSKIDEVLNDQRFDIVHYHGLDVADYYCETGIPAAVTLHLPPEWYPKSSLQLHGATYVFVSHSQAASRTGQVIPNGVDVQRLAAVDLPRTHLLCLARICPEKGIHLALQAAHLANEPLIIAGPIHPFQTHREYFTNEVRPLLDGKRQYVGAVGIDEKIRLLASAKALLIPSLAAETSSLVAMEAAAAGTPVIAFRSGALPEVIEDHSSGFIVNDLVSMAEAIRHLEDISQERCRAIARTRFRKEEMAARYLSLYRELSGVPQ